MGKKEIIQNLYKLVLKRLPTPEEIKTSSIFLKTSTLEQFRLKLFNERITKNKKTSLEYNERDNENFCLLDSNTPYMILDKQMVNQYKYQPRNEKSCPYEILMTGVLKNSNIDSLKKLKSSLNCHFFFFDNFSTKISKQELIQWMENDVKVSGVFEQNIIDYKEISNGFGRNFDLIIKINVSMVEYITLDMILQCCQIEREDSSSVYDTTSIEIDGVELLSIYPNKLTYDFLF